MKKLFFDIDIEHSKSQREYTPEGYMRVGGRASRVGLQTYRAGELEGMDNYDEDELLSVMRTPEEVFSKESLASFKDKDITLEHPKDLIDCKTYKDCSVGHCCSEGRRDGDYVVVDLLIKDKEAIKAIEDGKVNLSAGYTADFEEKQGTYKGEPFSHLQKDIYINHVAVVDNPRAGDKAKIFDSKGMPMFFKKKVSVLDEESATKIQDAFEEMSKKVAKLEEKMQKFEDSKDIEFNDESFDVDRIVQSVKSRILKDQDGTRKTIRDEIQKALKNI